MFHSRALKFGKKRKLKQFIFISLKDSLLKIHSFLNCVSLVSQSAKSFLLFGYLNLHNPLISLFTHFFKECFLTFETSECFSGFFNVLKIPESMFREKTVFFKINSFSM